MVEAEIQHKVALELETEVQWLVRLVQLRFQHYFQSEENAEAPSQAVLPAPDWPESPTPYAQAIRKHKLQWAERVAVALCLAAHLRPQALDLFFVKNATYDRAFAQFGGAVPTAQSPFLPTGTTLLFLLAGDDISERLKAQQLLAPASKVFRLGLLELGRPSIEGRRASGVLRLTQEAIADWTEGVPYRPEFSAAFPAQRIHAQREWEELVLPSKTTQQLEEIKQWIDHSSKIMNDWKMQGKLRPGYRALFHGPPGTGKTMAAGLLGKTTKRDIYRIDLSMVISKYIGETEKNLAQVFWQAEHQNWILFFDEADALFGKRTEIKDAHDRYANQEVAYLLQRVEQYQGVVILASNFRQNLDDAFARRFESMIYFPMPGPNERLRLWHQSFPDENLLPREEALQQQLPKIAQQYKLSGGAIMNIGRFAVLQAASRKNPADLLLLKDVMEGVRREYGKEGRSV